jgi:hypothetical protein
MRRSPRAYVSYGSFFFLPRQGASEAMRQARQRAAVAVALAAAVALSTVGASAQPAPPALLAVVGRQLAWLNLEAPRHRVISKLAATANALEVTAQPDGSHIVASVGAPFATGGARGADLVQLDPNTGEATPLLQRTDAKESLNSPAWWPDHATLLFERQDLSGQPVGAPGQEVPRYPSRIERVVADGSGRAILLAEGRQPAAAPDGTRMVFARTTNQGASLLVWSQVDGSAQTIVPEGRFADVAYPQFSPTGDTIAFVAPQSGVNGQRNPLETLLGVHVAYAHGIPWDAWLVSLDGTGLKRIAETGADEPSVTWSPDGTQLFVYSGTGSYLIEALTGTVTPFTFVQGYGPVAWVNN